VAAPEVNVDAVMAELRVQLQTDLRKELLRHGASRALEDPDIYAAVESALREALRRSDRRALLLPELLGDPSGWRLEPALKVGSHRGRLAAGVIRGVKQRLLMPALRWLFEYTHDNFVRQQRMNHVLIACVQELATQNALLRRDVDRLAPAPPEAR
jgi:hypothetical protein